LEAELKLGNAQIYGEDVLVAIQIKHFATFCFFSVLKILNARRVVNNVRPEARNLLIDIK